MWCSSVKWIQSTLIMKYYYSCNINVAIVFKLYDEDSVDSVPVIPHANEFTMAEQFSQMKLLAAKNKIIK